MSLENQRSRIHTTSFAGNALTVDSLPSITGLDLSAEEANWVVGEVKRLLPRREVGIGVIMATVDRGIREGRIRPVVNLHPMVRRMMNHRQSRPSTAPRRLLRRVLKYVSII